MFGLTYWLWIYGRGLSIVKNWLHLYIHVGKIDYVVMLIGKQANAITKDTVFIMNVMMLECIGTSYKMN